MIQIKNLTKRYEDIKERLFGYNPIDLTEQPLDFEEEFMLEVIDQGVER